MYDTKEKCRELAAKFKQLCAERGTTPYKIARHSGLSSSTVSCFLTGKTVPRIDTMMILCNQLGISITDIFDEREMVEVHAQEEELILHTYRNLPEDKKKAVLKYLKCWTGIRKTRDKCNILWYDVIVIGHMRRKK